MEEEDLEERSKSPILERLYRRNWIKAGNKLSRRNIRVPLPS